MATDEIKNIINRWLNTCIQQELWLKYYDLHVNEVYQDEISNVNWVTHGLELLTVANEQNQDSDFIVVLSISLKPVDIKEIKSFSFNSLTTNDLDETPPSVYLFKKGWAMWLDTLNESKFIEATAYGDIYHRQLTEDGLVHRILYVIPHSD